MKCKSCGSDNSAALKFCEYCGVDLHSQSQTASQSQSNNQNLNSSSSDLNSYIPSSKDPIFHVWNKDFPKNSFNWLAFIFPVAFLAGYGAKKPAVGAAFQIFLMLLAVDILYSAIGLNLLLLGLHAYLLVLVPLLFFSYKVSIHSDYLIGRKPEFNMVFAIVAQIIYTIVYNWAVL
jgi:hypothetical protein